MYGGMTHFVHSVERALSVTAILITLPHGQPHRKKWPMIIFYTISPHRKYMRLRKTWAEEACMLFTAVSRPSSQWFCLVQPPKHSCLKSVPKHEWKRSSDSVSLVFPKGSNCSVFSNFILLFPRFLFHLGARHFFSTHRTPFSYLWGGA